MSSGNLTGYLGALKKSRLDAHRVITESIDDPELKVVSKATTIKKLGNDFSSCDSRWGAAIEAKSKLPEDILRELRKIGENVASKFLEFTNRRHTDHGVLWIKY